MNKKTGYNLGEKIYTRVLARTKCTKRKQIAYQCHVTCFRVVISSNADTVRTAASLNVQRTTSVDTSNILFVS